MGKQWWKVPGDVLWTDADGGWTATFQWDDGTEWGLAIEREGGAGAAMEARWDYTEGYPDIEAKSADFPRDLRKQLVAQLVRLGPQPELSQEQTRVLDLIADGMEERGWQSGKRIRANLEDTDPAHVNKVLDKLRPRYVLRTVYPDRDSFLLTLAGLLRSKFSVRATKLLNDTLQVIQREYKKDPEVRAYTWNALQERGWMDSEREFARAVIGAAGLSSEYDQGRWTVPDAVEEVRRCGDLGSFRALLREGRGTCPSPTAPMQAPSETEATPPIAAPSPDEPTTVFYSWQSRYSKTNRNLIQGALEHAVKDVKDAYPMLVVDRDTSGLPGSPNIMQAILAKIRKAKVFVADVSLVVTDPESPSPNPNVLFELGYAVSCMSWDNIVLVVNEHLGDVKALPFDLRGHRCVTYRFDPESGDEPAEARNHLRRLLSTNLREVLGRESPSNRKAR